MNLTMFFCTRAQGHAFPTSYSTKGCSLPLASRVQPLPSFNAASTV